MNDTAAKAVDMGRRIERISKVAAAISVLSLTVQLLLMVSSNAPVASLPNALQVPGDCIVAGQNSATILALSPQPSPEPGFNDTSEYMIGSISVQLIYVESNGSIDPDTENWTDPMKTDVYNGEWAAVNWWATNPLGPQLNFTIHNMTGNTSYEPINRPQTDEGLWIGQIMRDMGYSSGDYSRDVKAYINDMRASDGKDWGFVVFVVNSLNDADGRFPDGYFAYSYLGGPFTVLTYDNDGWGIARLNQVAAHEMGHIFYATDEYDRIPQFSGYLDSLEVERSGAIMDTCALWISTGTLRQIGWYDSDSDGIFDIVDTEPAVTLTSVPPQYTNASQIDFSGTASVIPYPNHNPIGPKNDVTVAKISSVSYNLDGSGWIPATASDGSFNQTTEAFNFSFPSTSGHHTISVMAITDQGVYSGTNATDDFYVNQIEPNSSVRSLPAYTNSTTITIEANAIGIPGLSSVELWYSKDGGSYAEYSTLYGLPWEWQFISSLTGGEGSYSLYTIATDTVGNRETTPATPDAQTVIDTTKPVSTVSSVPGLSNNSMITLTADASDIVGVYSLELWYSSLGEPWRLYGTLYSTPWQWSIDTAHFGGDGDYKLSTRARDNAGNQEDYRFSVPDVSTTIDTHAPVTSAEVTGALSSSGWYTDGVSLNLSSQDQTSGVASTYYRMDGGSWVTYSVQFDVTSEGIHTIEFYSNDNAGNSESHRTLQVGIDMTGPNSEIHATGTVGAGGWFTGAVTLVFEANDSLSGTGMTFYRLDNGAFAEFDSPVTDLADGVYTIECFSIDLAGNNGTHVSLPLKIDTTAPGITDMTPSFRATDSTVTISWSGSDSLSGIDHYEVIIDGGVPYGIGNVTEITLTLEDGAHSISVVAFDRAGNTATKSTSVSVDTSLISTRGPAGPWLDIGIFAAVLIGSILALLMLMRFKRDRNGANGSQKSPPASPPTS